ncbi:MAG: hypothetical protein WCF24_02225 [Acidimicrobiales bacterium]
MRTARTKKLHVTGVGLALAAVAVLLAACGSGSAAPGVASLKHSSSTSSPKTPGTIKTSAGGGASGTAGASAGTMGMGGATLQFSVCMRSHGYPKFPDPNGQGQISVSGINPSSSAFQSAQNACRKYITGPSGKPPSQAQRAKMLANALKFATCMRSHGITDYPDPTATPGGGIKQSIRASAGSNLSPNNPLFQKAQKACQGSLGKVGKSGGIVALG